MKSALDFLGKACAGYPHLQVKIAVDCVEKGYASHEQVAEFLGLSVHRWKRYYHGFQEGSVQRIPQIMRNLMSAQDLRFLTGFSDEELNTAAQIVELAQQEAQTEGLLWQVFLVWEAERRWELYPGAVCQHGF